MTENWIIDQKYIGNNNRHPFYKGTLKWLKMEYPLTGIGMVGILLKLVREDESCA